MAYVNEVSKKLPEL